MLSWVCRHSSRGSVGESHPHDSGLLVALVQSRPVVMRVVSVPALQASPLVVRGRRRSRRGAGDGGLVVVAPGLLAPLSGESCEAVGSHCSLLLSHGVHCKSKKKQG